MTLNTAHYHSLTCNARVDNIVEPTCGMKSPGKWHDAELMLKEAEALGWTSTGKGHLCPTHSAQVAETEKPSPKPSRAKREPDPVANDWPGGQ